jgi:hypothetical protein
MRTDPPRSSAFVLAIDVYALVSALFAWHCWHHDRSIGLQFWSLMFPLSFYLTAKMIRECPIMILPPLIVLAWGLALATSPLYLAIEAIDATCRWAWARRKRKAVRASAGASVRRI